MKTKKLIELLQNADPTGEEEVCVGNEDIHYVIPLPAYYDGTLQVIDRDSEDNPIAVRFKRSGLKISIHPYSIRDVLFDNPNTPIDYSELPPERAEVTKKHYADYLAWCKNLDNEIEYKYFKEWAFKKANLLSEDLVNFEETVKLFFDKNISPQDPLPLGNNSYYTRRLEQWSSLYDVILEDAWIKIKKVK